MRIIKPYYQFENMTADPLKTIEKAARTCWDSVSGEGSELDLVAKLIKRKHFAMIEFASMTYRLWVDRGISHELVRMRIASYAQRSTRYCDEKNTAFVLPPWVDIPEGEYKIQWVADGIYVCDNMPVCNKADLAWFDSMALAERTYARLLDLGWSLQQARSVLPNSLQTEIVICTNFREWRHIFELRDHPKAHPQMQEIMGPIHDHARKNVPLIFD